MTHSDEETSWRSVGRRGLGSIRVSRVVFGGDAGIGTRGRLRSPDPLRAATIRKLDSNLSSLSMIRCGESGYCSYLRSSEAKLLRPATLRDHRIIIDSEVGARASLCSDHAWFGFAMLKALQTPLFTGFARGGN